MLLNRPPIIDPLFGGGLLTNIIHENAAMIRKTPFNYTYRSQKTKDFVKLKMRFSNYRSQKGENSRKYFLQEGMKRKRKKMYSLNDVLTIISLSSTSPLYPVNNIGT